MPILKAEEEFFSDDEDKPSVNQVDEFPEAFNDYLEDNADRIEAAHRRGTLPYWVKDNFTFDDEGKMSEAYGKNLEEGQSIEGDAKLLFLDKKAKGYTLEEMSIEIEHTPFTEDQIKNHREIEEKLGVERGERMTFAEADNGAANPNYPWWGTNKYTRNCTMTVVAHEMRVRGWNVEALGMDPKIDVLSKMLHGATNLPWIDPQTGKTPVLTEIKGNTIERMQEMLRRNTREEGRYHLSYNLKRLPWQKPKGHILCIDKLASGELRIHDAQSGDIIGKELFDDISTEKPMHLLKVDGLMINPKYVDQIIKGAD